MSSLSSQKCPLCGAPLSDNAPAGLCPNCLMALNLKTQTVFTGDSPAAHPPLPPEEIAPLFPQLEILECLGRGGMGVVYKARQKTLNRLAALKLLAPERAGDATFAARFTREAQALAALSHPNIVTIYDFGRAGGFYFLLMEFVDGVNLRQLLRARKFTPEEALAVVPPLCDALQFAHDRGIVHRDIKPENLLLNKQGRVKVADFGIAKMLGGGDGGAGPGLSGPAVASAETTTQSTVGTPGYSAPEQKSDPQRVDSRADIYSLGVVFYEMLTGELPGKRLEPPSKKVQIDVRLDEVVLRALEKTPELRWQTAAQMRKRVETIACTSSDPSPPNEKVSTPESQPRCSRLAIAGACCSLLFLVTMLMPSVLEFFVGAHIWTTWSSHTWRLLDFMLQPVALASGLAMTLLGWRAVSQIVHSAGRIRGLGLAVYAGLCCPLFVLDSLILNAPFAFRGMTLFGVAVTWIAVLAFDFLVVWSVWRAVNKRLDSGLTVPPPPPGRIRPVSVLGIVLALGIVFLGLDSTVAFLRVRDENARKRNPADWPDILQTLPTAAVIQAGLDKPAQAPWPWMELQNRAKAGRLSTNEADKIVDELAAWMRRDYPHGYDQPLNWLGNLLDELSRDHLVAERNAMGFLDAYYGSPSLEALPRVREGDINLQLTCKWKSPWDGGQHTFGFDFLNEMRSISVDGQLVFPHQLSPRQWGWQQYMGGLQLLKLAPGKHIVRCEVESALVPVADMAGFANDAPSTDWPTAKRRWIRVCQADLVVCGKDAEIVSLTEDPALDPVATGALSVRQVIIRRKGAGLAAFVALNMIPQRGLPISVDVTLRFPKQDFKCGNLWAVQEPGGNTNNRTDNGLSLTADIGPLGPQIKDVEILLTPNPKAIESHPGI
ncbi:MAG: protein kinase, partial [Verrucomicrobiota bacterium]